MLACDGVGQLDLKLSSDAAVDDASDPDAPKIDEGPPLSRFAVPQTLGALDGEHFFDHPWPSDLRREADGSVRLEGFINPRESALIKKYQGQFRGRLFGFSPAGAGYLGFTNALDLATLPVDAAASLLPTSTLQLVDVDDKSPELGTRKPIVWRYRDKIGDYYTVPHTLAWMPLIGNPLRPKTRYAIVVTRALKSVAGAAFSPTESLAQVVTPTSSSSPPVAALAAQWKPAVDALDKAGVPRDRIAQLSIFTTSDPTAELLKVAEDARSLPPPKVTDLKAQGSDPAYDRYTGNYSGSPDYQVGVVPFNVDGGNFVFDAAGKPIKQRDFSLRFLLAVPNADKCPMPTGGYPIILYAHGTGGDFSSFDGDGTARALAQQCVASMGIDQIFHGIRPGAPPDGDPNKESKISLLFFNVSNGLAACTNPRQAAIDEVARARLVSTGGLVVSAAVSKTGSAIAFDPKRIGFFGHSQGGLNGPLMLAVDDQLRGGVLSGAGSDISYSLLAKTKPEPSVAGLVTAFSGIQVENLDELNELHPLLSLIQLFIDPADPVHYYAALNRAPFAGHKAKSILMTEGVNADGTGDSFAPPRTIEAGAIAGHFPLLSPVVRDVPELTLAGLSTAKDPLSGNGAGGNTTIALAQFVPPKGVDGHFVVFHVPQATSLAAKFCASLLGSDGAPTMTETR